MLFYFNLFFVYLVLKSAGAKNPFDTLDIDNYDKKYFKIKCMELDNVYYDQFTPTKKFLVKYVNQSGTKIWESDGIASCVYSLLARLNGKPHLLYFKVDRGYTDDHLYYVKKDHTWTPIDIYEYSNSINELKKGVKIDKYFSLNVSFSFAYDLYTVDYATADQPYTYFTPNVGFVATQVLYNSTKLWKAENKGDRCVAAWAHIHNGSYYMIRLLITKVNEESELKTFFIIKNNWQLVHTLQHNYDSKEPVKGPENFFYPNYTFNLKPVNNDHEISNEVKYDMFSEGKKLPTVSENSEYLEYFEGKYYSTPSQSNNSENKEDKTNSTTDSTDSSKNNTNNSDNTNNSSDNKEDEEKENVDKNDVNEDDNDDKEQENKDKQDGSLDPLNPSKYQPFVKVIRKNNCIQLDVSKRLDNHKYENLGLFDKYLQVVTYNPPPAMYFDKVMDGIKPLFVGDANTICQSVNFYLKDDNFYLAEVIVRNEDKDSTRHFKMNNDRWLYVETKKFLESLNELKNLTYE